MYGAEPWGRKQASTWDSGRAGDNVPAMFSASGDLYDLIYGAFKDYAAEAAAVAAVIHAHRPDARDVLDVACGTGEHARHLARAFGFHVDGVDIAPALVAHAQAKNPGGRFSQGDMRDFDLGRQYDAVTCLFSSIGYAATLDGVTDTLVCLRRHLRPDGIMLVEPWFEPGHLEDGYVTVRSAQSATKAVARVSRNEIRERTSILHVEYLVAEATGIRHLVERHELGLFTRAEMEAAFHRAGLKVSYQDGPAGRGLYVGRGS